MMNELLMLLVHGALSATIENSIAGVTDSPMSGVKNFLKIIEVSQE